MQTVLDSPRTKNISLESARKLVQIALREDTLIILHNVSWEDYGQLMDDREIAGRRSPRLDYSVGTLWIDPKAAPQNGLSLRTIRQAIEIALDENSSVAVHHVKWETYEKILAERNGSHNPRFFYHRERLLIMPTSLEHEAVIRFLEMFVNFVAAEWRMKCTGFRSATFRRNDIKEGFEPDSCFYFGANAEMMRGKKRFDGESDPAPDLIIEVDITSPSEMREETFAAFGVPEIWRFKDETIQILKLEGKKYAVISQSLAIPSATANKLLEFVFEGETLEHFEWFDKAREWARAVKS